MKNLLSCEICGYRAKSDESVVRLREDGVIRCKVCYHNAVYGHYVSDKYIRDNPLPEILDDWKDYVTLISN